MKDNAGIPVRSGDATTRHHSTARHPKRMPSSSASSPSFHAYRHPVEDRQVRRRPGDDHPVGAPSADRRPAGASAVGGRRVDIRPTGDGLTAMSTTEGNMRSTSGNTPAEGLAGNRSAGGYPASAGPSSWIEKAGLGAHRAKVSTVPGRSRASVVSYPDPYERLRGNGTATISAHDDVTFQSRDATRGRASQHDGRRTRSNLRVISGAGPVRNLVHREVRVRGRVRVCSGAPRQDVLPGRPVPMVCPGGIPAHHGMPVPAMRWGLMPGLPHHHPIPHGASGAMRPCRHVGMRAGSVARWSGASRARLILERFQGWSSARMMRRTDSGPLARRGV